MSARPLVVLRPQPGNAATCAAARALGLEAVAAPLFEIAPLPWTPPDPAVFDALLFGSANALRHGGDALDGFRGLPAYAVGETTASVAREHGFTIAAIGNGGLQELLPKLADAGRTAVLRLAGQEHVALSPPSGVRIETTIVYAARPVVLGAPAAGALQAGAVVLLHSAEAARRFTEEAARLGLEASRIALACLGPRIAAAAGQGWAEVRISAAQDDRALLAMAAEMCQQA